MTLGSYSLSLSLNGHISLFHFDPRCEEGALPTNTPFLLPPKDSVLPPAIYLVFLPHHGHPV